MLKGVVRNVAQHRPGIVIDIDRADAGDDTIGTLYKFDSGRYLGTRFDPFVNQQYAFASLNASFLNPSDFARPV